MTPRVTRHFLCGGVIAFAAAFSAHAAPPAATTAPATQAIAPDLQSALNDLSADDPQTRASAQDRIVRFGNEAAGPLQQLIATTEDIEQRNGASAALARIAEDASTGATIVTFHATNLTPSDLVDAFAKNTGMAIHINGGGGNDSKDRISIAIDHEPFWQAVRKLCKASSLNFSNGYNDGQAGLVLQRGSEETLSRPFVIDGPFMVIANSISMNSSVSLTQPVSSSKSETINLQCFAEPKLKISQRSYNAHFTEATDDTGVSLVSQNGVDNDMSDASDARNYWDMSTPIGLPADAAKKIVKLRGQVPVTVVTRSETIEIANILQAKNVVRRAGGNTLTVKDVTVEGDQITVNVAMQVPPNKDQVGFQLAQSITLVDANGTVMTNQGANGGSFNGRLEYKVQFSQGQNGDKKPGPPAKLVLAVPLESKSIACNFQFDNLPLP